jgi:acyl carrier protein
MSAPADIRAEVSTVLSRVLEESGRVAKPARDEDALAQNIGLDSLDLAQVVVLLDQRFGVEPFRKPGVIVRTFGDLVRVYAEAIQK